jgi:hypothetical protein
VDGLFDWDQEVIGQGRFFGCLFAHELKLERLAASRSEQLLHAAHGLAIDGLNEIVCP